MSHKIEERCFSLRALHTGFLLVTARFFYTPNRIWREESGHFAWSKLDSAEHKESMIEVSALGVPVATLYSGGGHGRNCSDEAGSFFRSEQSKNKQTPNYFSHSVAESLLLQNGVPWDNRILPTPSPKYLLRKVKCQQLNPVNSKGRSDSFQ